KLFRIKYNDGNRKPIAKASSEKRAGSVPFEVKLTAKGTIDYDDNISQYKWVIGSGNDVPITFMEQNPVLSIDTPGKYQAILTVTDSDGATDSDTTEIIAGNDPPKVAFQFIESNNSFY